MEARRICVLYAYHNAEVAGRFQDGLIYLDSESGRVQWQCDASWTDWHGEFNITAEQMKVAFDCQQSTRPGPPRPKSTVLFLTPSGRYEGYDYKMRRVTVTPKAKFSYTTTGAWIQIEEWSETSKEWMSILDDV